MKCRVKATCAIALSTVVLLTGCGMTQTYSDEQTQQMAEYMAKKLLDYDKNYEEKLIVDPVIPEAEEDISEEEPVQTPEPAAEKDTSTTEKGKKDKTEKEKTLMLSDLFAADGIKLQYQDVEVCQSYPKDGTSSYFVVEAAISRKLVVVKFAVRNTSNKTVSLESVMSGVSYSLNTSSGTMKPDMTLLTNDLQYLDRTLQAGNAAEAVLVFEVPSGDSCKNMTLQVTNSKGTGVQKIS